MAQENKTQQLTKPSRATAPRQVQVVNYEDMLPSNSSKLETTEIVNDKYNAKQYNERLNQFKNNLTIVITKSSPMIKSNSTVQKAMLFIEAAETGSLLRNQINDLVNELPLSPFGRLLGRGALIDLNYGLRNVLSQYSTNYLIIGDTDAMQKAINMSNQANEKEKEEMSNRLTDVETELKKKQNILDLREEQLRQKEEELEKAQNSIIRLSQENNTFKTNAGESSVQYKYVVENKNLKQQNAALTSELAQKQNEVVMLKQQNQILQTQVQQLQADLKDLKTIFPFKNKQEFNEHEEQIKIGLREQIREEFQEIINRKDTEFDKTLKLHKEEMKDMKDSLKMLMADKKARDQEAKNEMLGQPIPQSYDLHSFYSNPPKSISSGQMFGSPSFGGRK